MVHWDTVKCQHNPACVQMPILMGPVDQVSSTFQARLRLQGGHRQGVLAPTMRRMISGPSRTAQSWCAVYRTQSWRSPCCMSSARERPRKP